MCQFKVETGFIPAQARLLETLWKAERIAPCNRKFLFDSHLFTP